jgi:hypothetical protein
MQTLKSRVFRIAKSTTKTPKFHRATDCDVADALRDSDYMHESIRSYAKQHLKTCHASEFGAAGVRVRLRAYHPRDDEAARRRTRRLCVHAQRVLKLVRMSMTTQLPSRISIVYLDVPIPKSLPSSTIVTSEHVNSGVTITQSGRPPWIAVYRREEAPKVLTHELIHACGGSYLDDDRGAARQRELVTSLGAPSAGRPALNEAFVEALACVVYALFVSAEREDDKDAVQKTLTRERRHALRQAARVFGRAETTHAFAYYVGKAALLCETRDEDELVALLTPGARYEDETRASALSDALARFVPRLSSETPARGGGFRMSATRESGFSVRGPKPT